MVEVSRGTGWPRMPVGWGAMLPSLFFGKSGCAAALGWHGGPFLLSCRHPEGRFASHSARPGCIPMFGPGGLVSRFGRRHWPFAGSVGHARAFLGPTG